MNIEDASNNDLTGEEVERLGHFPWQLSLATGRLVPTSNRIWFNLPAA